MLPLRATRPRLLARRFILARASTLLHKSVLHSPFYSPSSIFSFLPNAAHLPYWILSPQLSLLAPPLSHFTPPSASAHMQALPLPLISVSRTDSSAAPLGLSDDFLPRTLFVVTDEMALSILAAGVSMAIHPFRSLTSRDLSHLRVRAFTIFEASPLFRLFLRLQGATTYSCRSTGSIGITTLVILPALFFQESLLPKAIAPSPSPL